MLPESDRKDLAIQALARSTTISDLSVRHRVSRKFVYQQAHKAGAALDEVFLSGTPGDDVLFHLTVSKTWLRQVIVALTLICRSSYRGVVEFLRDLLGDRAREIPCCLSSVGCRFWQPWIWLSVSACSLKSRTRRTAVRGPAAPP